MSYKKSKTAIIPIDTASRLIFADSRQFSTLINNNTNFIPLKIIENSKNKRQKYVDLIEFKKWYDNELRNDIFVRRYEVKILLGFSINSTNDRVNFNLIFEDVPRYGFKRKGFFKLSDVNIKLEQLGMKKLTLNDFFKIE